ncbi:MAG: DNA/RNA non-specific endonuclease [Bacteroidales bacterium]|nr:DNA/RNA non-specific endonuclease [Bacteroidales bacterium]
MKKIFVWAAAVAVLWSCSKELSPEPSPVQSPDVQSPKEVFHMQVETAETKTVIEEESSTQYNVLWQSGDDIAVYEVSSEGISAQKTVSDPLEEDGATASFGLSFEGSPTGPFHYTFVYPSNALSKDGGDYLVTLPSHQLFAANSFDPNADVLVSRTVNAAERPAVVHASFARVGATALLNLMAPTTTETISRITFSTTEAFLSGAYTLDPATGELWDIVSGEKSIVLTPASETTYTGSIPVWFRLAGVTLSNNFTVKVETDYNIYTKTVDLAAAGVNLEFRDGALTKFAINMSAVEGVSNWDVIDVAYTGIKNTNYATWGPKKGSYSDAYYKGNTNKDKNNDDVEYGFRMRTDNNNTGIVTTVSNGYVRAVRVSLPNLPSKGDRTVSIYASNTAYSSPEDLFNDSTSGVLVGSVSISQNQGPVDKTIWLEDAYQYVAFRSGAASVLISAIAIKWDDSAPAVSHVGEITSGWLELPATDSDLSGTSTSSLEDLKFVTHYASMGGRSQRNYSMLYDPEMYASYWVAYPLCADHLGSGRTESWAYDPDVPKAKQTDIKHGAYGVSFSTDKYDNQYYSRGHQIPNADRNGVDDMMAQTYYATNMTPQMQHGLNGGVWSNLEGAIRNVIKNTADTVYVVTGAAFCKKGGSETINTIINGQDGKELPVPNYYWKAVLKVKWNGSGEVVNAKACGFWLEHRDDLNAYTNYRTSVDQIEAWTGLDLFTNLPVALQTSAEASSDWNAFQAF